MSDLSQSRLRVRQELKEKEEENQQVKKGLSAALGEITKLKLLLQVQRLQLDTVFQLFGYVTQIIRNSKLLNDITPGELGLHYVRWGGSLFVIYDHVQSEQYKMKMKLHFS